jgi:hypothetical protein
MTRSPDEPTTTEQITGIARAMRDPNARAMAKDFHKLLAERVQGPRDRILDLVDEPNIKAMLLTDEILDVGMGLMAVAMDKDTADRIQAIQHSDSRAKAMAEVELVMLLRSFLGGVVAVKAEAGGLGMIELGEVAARAKSAKFLL